MHVLIFCVALALGATPDAPPDLPAVTKATESLIDAVASAQSWPQGSPCLPPAVSDQLKAGVSRELWDNPEVQASYTHLAASGRSYDWFRAIEELQEGKAAWCLASGLCHPDAEVRTKCALALTRLGDHAPASFALEVADAIAVPGPTDDHGRFQHALAEYLNASTRLSIMLKPGPDPATLRAALPRWKQALRGRTAPIKRSATARAAMEQIKLHADACVITASIAPKPQGEWDPAFNLTTVRLSVAPPIVKPGPDPVTGKPTTACARMTPDQLDVLLGALADNGFFDAAKAAVPDRTDRHGTVVIACGTSPGSPRYCVSYDWAPDMLGAMDAIRLSLDGEPARLMRQLTDPMADQRAEWARTAQASKQ